MSLTGVQAGPLVRGTGTTVGKHGVRPITSQGTEQHVLYIVFDAVHIIVMFLWLDVHSVQNVENGQAEACTLSLWQQHCRIPGDERLGFTIWCFKLLLKTSHMAVYEKRAQCLVRLYVLALKMPMPTLKFAACKCEEPHEQAL